MQKSRYWAFIIYPESMPENYISILNEYHLPMAISPLHDADLNANGDEKKAHYHVLVIYGNTTTEKNIQSISDRVNGTKVISVMSLKGYYRYLQHLDNPEKTNYSDKPITHLAGFEPSDYWSYTAQEETKMRMDIIALIKENQIKEYYALCDFLLGYDLSLFRYATSQTILFNTLITSYRNSIVNKKMK